MMTMTRQLMTIAGLALTTGACIEPEEPSVIEIDTLSGMSFELESAEGYTLMEGTTFYLSFSDNYVSAYAGCNSIEANYSLEEGVLMVDMMASTDMWCSEAHSQQDDWLKAFLSSAPLLERTDTMLILQTDEATLSFLDQEVATPDLPLTAGTWTVDTIIEGKGMSTSNLDEYPVMWFSDDGTFGFSSACTEIEGEYVASGEILSLSNVLLTIIECNDEPVSTFDQSIYEIIDDGAFNHDIDANRLTIMQGPIGFSAISN
jgi:heat shock protein HslJ